VVASCPRSIPSGGRMHKISKNRTSHHHSRWVARQVSGQRAPDAAHRTARTGRRPESSPRGTAGRLAAWDRRKARRLETPEGSPRGNPAGDRLVGSCSVPAVVERLESLAQPSRPILGELARGIIPKGFKPID